MTPFTWDRPCRFCIVDKEARPRGGAVAVRRRPEWGAEIVRWFETLFTNPGPINAPLEFAKADPQRIALIVACQNAGQVIISTNANATVAQGLIVGPTPPYLVLALRDWGILIQQGWNEINASGFPEAFTVWEVLTANADDAASITPAASLANQSMGALRRQAQVNESSRPWRTNPLDSLADKIREKLWERIRKLN